MQGYLGRPWTIGGSVFISWMAFPAALVALLGLVSGPRSSIRCTVQLAAAIFRIITERRVFVVQGWRGGMAAGLEWSEPIGIMMAWRRSLVTITATGGATLNSGELVQMLVLGAGNARSGASTRAVPPSGVSGS